MRWYQVERPKTSGSGSSSTTGTKWSDFDLAALEGEALLLGNWKNIEELEESLTLEELDLLVRTARDKEERMMKFYAAFKGVDLDASSKEQSQDVFDAVQRRAEARLTGRDVEDLEFEELGIEIMS